MSTPTGDSGGQQYGGRPDGGQGGNQYGAPQYGEQPSGGQQYGQQYGAGQYGDQGQGQGQYGAAQYGSAPYAGQAYPGGTGQPVAAPKNGFGIAALVLGIIGLVLMFTVVVSWLGGILGLAAIVFAILGMNKAKAGEATNRGMAIGGLVTGILAVIGAIVITIILVVVANAVGNSDYGQCLTNAGGDQQAIEQCLNNIGN